MKGRINRWHAIANWLWDTGTRGENEDGEDGEGDVCGICRVPFEGCCPQCKLPGDDCPLSKSYIQLSNLNIYLRIQLLAWHIT